MQSLEVRATSQTIRGSKTVIVVLHYGDAATTLSCIHSIPLEGYPLIVVDNGPEPFSEDTLDYPYDCFVLHSGANLGYAGGMNAGIDFSMKMKPDFILLLTNDVCLDQKTVKALIDSATKFPALGAVGPVINLVNSGQVWTPKPSTILEALDEKRFRVTELVGAVFLVRREAIERIGRFDEAFFMYGEDTELSHRLRAAGYELAVDTAARARHYMSNKGFYTAEYQVYYRSRNMILLVWKDLKNDGRLARVIRFARLTLLYHGPHLIRLVRTQHFGSVRALVEGWNDGVLWILGMHPAGMKGKFKHGLEE